jgi:uncharacterized membrane protein
MNLAHLHLLLNHFPIIGTLIGVGLFLVSFVGKNQDLKRASLIIFAVMALITLPTFFSGVGAQGAIHGKPGVSDELIARHEGAAMLAIWFMEITGALSLIGLWQLHSKGKPAGWNVAGVLLFSLITMGLMSRVGNTGGDIRHPEDNPGQTTVTDGPVSAMIAHFEPSPQAFTDLMIGNKFWWAFMMDLHFIGLAMLIGATGILNLRMLGFAKQLPLEPLHHLVPWALAGFGINVVTGVLAFVGMPAFYTYDIVFWLKMSTLFLLGLNAAAFYMTDIFPSVEHMGPGDDAPPLAKFVAGSSLFLWFVVITLGRYIQSYTDSIPIHPH